MPLIWPTFCLGRGIRWARLPLLPGELAGRCCPCPSGQTPICRVRSQAQSLLWLALPCMFHDQVEEFIRESAPHRWGVDANRMVLGVFSFNKLLMYLDLGDPSAVNNEIVVALFGDQGFSEFGATVGDQERVDNRLAPSDVFHVLDADSSQALAIHEAGQGRNMVIQGPPGTGKSRTIANVIADAVARGKRVLFVSEKMATLEVVMRRLENIGLGRACLELHSHKTNKRETLDELRRCLNLSPPPADDSGRELLE